MGMVFPIAWRATASSYSVARTPQEATGEISTADIKAFDETRSHRADPSQVSEIVLEEANELNNTSQPCASSYAPAASAAIALSQTRLPTLRHSFFPESCEYRGN